MTGEVLPSPVYTRASYFCPVTRGCRQDPKHIMKPQYLKNLFASPQLHGKSVKLAKPGQHSEESRGKTELLGDEAQEAGVLHALGRPSEEIFAALVARDAGDPSMFNQLVKEGYVFGTLKEARAL